MKSSTASIFLLLFSFCAIQTLAQSPATEAQKALDRHISKNKSAGIAAGYATSERVLWIGTKGYADLEKQQLLDTTTYLRSASIAKPMTAVAILQLHEKGKLDLDKPIAGYLPDFPISKGAKISVRHLLQHASGINGYKSAKESETTKEYPSLEEAISVFGDRKLAFTPGSNFRYTSYGYVVLGWVIEQVSGMSYEEYMQENIWKPAGMLHTGIESFSQVNENQSRLYSQKNRNKKVYQSSNNKVEELKRTNLSNRIPGGGFYTTVEDLLKFGQAVLKHSLISEATTDLMWTDSGLKKEGNPYGLGWYLYGKNPIYGNVYGHSGTQAGASNQFMLLPEADLVVVVMSNTSHVWGHVFGLSVQLFEWAAKDKEMKK